MPQGMAPSGRGKGRPACKRWAGTPPGPTPANSVTARLALLPDSLYAGPPVLHPQYLVLPGYAPHRHRPRRCRCGGDRQGRGTPRHGNGRTGATGAVSPAVPDARGCPCAKGRWLAYSAKGTPVLVRALPMRVWPGPPCPAGFPRQRRSSCFLRRQQRLCCPGKPRLGLRYPAG